MPPHEKNALSENAIIGLLQKNFPLPHGIGDDAAILPLNADESYVITKDLLAEDRHFRMSYYSAADLAHKSLHVNLSDIAAMGGTPRYILLGISLPENTGGDFVREFLQAFSAGCKAANVELIGGDTTASAGKIFISVTAIGTVRHDALKLRSKASAGDILCVAGNLGDAHAGLLALENALPGYAELKACARRPGARLAEGAWFGEKRGVAAMMDLSDGLRTDLGKLCLASGAGARIDLEQLTPTPALVNFCAANDVDPLSCLLTGGEDYGLLVALKQENAENILREFSAGFGYPLQRIGTVTFGAGVRLFSAGRETSFTGADFAHFGEKA